MVREALTIGPPILALLPVVYYGFASAAARRFFRRALLDQPMMLTILICV